MNVGFLCFRKPKTQSGKHFLQKREPKLHENDKQCMLIKGGNTSEIVSNVLKELVSCNLVILCCNINMIFEHLLRHICIINGAFRLVPLYTITRFIYSHTLNHIQNKYSYIFLALLFIWNSHDILLNVLYLLIGHIVAVINHLLGKLPVSVITLLILVSLIK